VDVRIVDPDTAVELAPGRVGEIWVDSPSKALGYHGAAELTAVTFHATLRDSTDGKKFLRTGDLGFIHGGEIFVAGRHKDMVIVRGRNLYPQDLEESIYTSHSLIRAGRAVVFAQRGPGGEGEEIVALCEVGGKRVPSATLDEVVHAIRAKIVADHKVNPHKVVIATPGTVLKTTSGKLRRDATRRAYLSGNMDQRLLRTDMAAS
jgi:acyl-CoA synthetase (AMP-forming)/AMP-acid ligase II